MYSMHNRKTNKVEDKPLLSSVFSAAAQDKMSSGPVALLLLACMFLCFTLFHDLIYRSPILGLLASVAVTAVIFVLVNYLRLKIRRYFAEMKALEEQNRKEE